MTAVTARFLHFDDNAPLTADQATTPAACIVFGQPDGQWWVRSTAKVSYIAEGLNNGYCTCFFWSMTPFVMDAG